MVFSSFNMIYHTFASIPQLQFVLGTFINSYVINTLIILFYVTNYMRLRDHYRNMQFKFVNYITPLEIDQMNDILKKLVLYFSAIS
jgi:hypothetical protein